MRKLLALVLFAIVVCELEMTVTDDLLSKITKFEAGHNEFSDMPWEEAQKMFMRIPHSRITPKKEPVSLNVNLPESFDSREKWPACNFGVLNQKKCGSCWAFAGTEVLGTRFCIKGCTHGVLSPQDLVSCDFYDQGCQGGNLENEWYWMKTKGVTTDQCIKYVSGDGHVPECPEKCDDGSNIQRFKPHDYYHLDENEDAIMENVFNYGPVEVAFECYRDFMAYKDGVYEHQTGELAGGHAIIVIGWGIEDGKKYWLIQNSWGTNWGKSGFGKFLRGENHCGIEENVYGAEIVC